MTHSYRRDGPGGLPHVVLGVGIIMAIGLFTNFPNQFSFKGTQKEAPRMITTQGSQNAKCQANTLETIVGTIGCAGTKRAVHLEKTTLISADKD